MKYKILKDLQIFYREQDVMVQINEKNINDINSPHIFDIEDSENGYLEVQEIQIKNKKLEITYILPEHYQPLYLLKDYSTFYKLEIINQLLEMNVLKDSRTFLALQNVMVKDSRNIKLIYRADAHETLPYEKQDNLTQYKYFILSFVGKFTLEKYQKNVEKCLNKEKDVFLNNVYACEDFESLQKLVAEELTNEQRIFFSEEVKSRQNESKTKSKRLKTRILLTVLVTAAMLGLLAYQKNNSEKNIRQAKAESQLEIDFLNKIIVNDSEGIEKDMAKLDYPKEKQIDILIKLGEFEKAYELDKKADSKIIDFLVKAKRKGEIADLEINSDYIKTYQEIISYSDPTRIEMVLQLETDKNLIAACLETAIEHKDIAVLRRAKNELFESKERDVEIANELKIAVIDTIMTDNTNKIEDVYSNKDNQKEDVKKEVNELLEENNDLLLQKNEYLQEKGG